MNSVRGYPRGNNHKTKEYEQWQDSGNIIPIDETLPLMLLYAEPKVADDFRSWLFNKAYLGSGVTPTNTPYPNLVDVSWRNDFRERFGLTEATLRKMPEYSVWRKTVLKRDNYRCLRCGATSKLVAHHIYPIDYMFELAFDPDNGWTLCEDCHNQAHGWSNQRSRAIVVGWELHKQLARLARHWTTAKHDPSCFSLTLWEWVYPSTPPKLWVTKVGDGFAITSSNVEYKNLRYQKAEYVDLFTLALAQTGKRLTYEEALSEYKVQDLAGLANAMLDEHKSHPVALRPSQTFSTASYVKAYLRAMNVEPPMSKYKGAPEYLRYAEQANYGGRTELFVRREEVPVSYLDFKSQYAAVTTLMGLTKLLTAKRIYVKDATRTAQIMLHDDAHHLLGELWDKSSAFDLWSNLSIFCEVTPDNDLLPVRDQFRKISPREHVALAYFSSKTPHFYCLADLVAAKILTGKAPKINWAFQFVADGEQQNLKSVKLGGEVDLHPRDMFKTIVEARQGYPKGTRMNQFLKTMVAAGGFGIFGEINQNNEGKETPGEWFFPGIASAVTAGGRLLLAMLEASVLWKGGNIAYVDTDAAMINGVDPNEIVEDFKWLNPFDIPTSTFLEIEEENEGGQLMLWGSASKCYALFNRTDDGITIRKASRSGIAQYVAPVPKFENDIWKGVITGVYPEWIAEPAYRVVPFNSPRMEEKAELPFENILVLDDGILTPEFTYLDLVLRIHGRTEPTMEGDNGLLTRRTYVAEGPPRLIGKEGHKVTELITGLRKKLTYNNCQKCGIQLFGRSHQQHCRKCKTTLKVAAYRQRKAAEALARLRGEATLEASALPAS